MQSRIKVLSKIRIAVLTLCIFGVAPLGVTNFAKAEEFCKKPVCTEKLSKTVEQTREQTKEEEKGFINETVERISREMPQHLKRRGIYPHTFDNRAFFYDSKGNPIITKKGYTYEISDTKPRADYDGALLTEEELPEWKNFLGDLILESAAKSLEERLNHIKFYRDVTRHIESLGTSSFSITEKGNLYYFSSTDYDKLKMYNLQTKDAKLKFKFGVELRDIRLHPYTGIKLRSKHLPKITLKAFPLDNKVKAEVKKSKNNMDIGFKNSYHYDTGKIKNEVYATRYNRKKNAEIKLSLDITSGPQNESQKAVFLKYIYRF